LGFAHRAPVGVLPLAFRLAPAVDELAVGEGIESTASYMQEFGVASWATMNTSDLRNVILPPPPLAFAVTLLGENDDAKGERQTVPSDEAIAAATNMSNEASDVTATSSRRGTAKVKQSNCALGAGGCCIWCSRGFLVRRRRGSPQRFCSPRCRTAFWSAARCWVMRAIATQLITVENLKAAQRSVHAFPEASQVMPNIE
jgi:hypothetical protein